MWKVNIGEPQGVIQHFQKMGASVVSMDVGDISYGDFVGFLHLGENLLNFDNTILQAERLKEKFPSAFILVEGELAKILSKGNAVFNRDVTSQVLGLISSLCVLGVTPIFCSNQGMLVLLAERIVKKITDGKKRNLDLRLEETKGYGDDKCVSVLLGFGIGLPKAQAISDSYSGDLRAVLIDLLNAPEKLKRVKGVGEVTVNEMWKVCGVV